MLSACICTCMQCPLKPEEGIRFHEELQIINTCATSVLTEFAIFPCLRWCPANTSFKGVDEYSSVVACLPAMCKSLGSTSDTSRTICLVQKLNDDFSISF